MVGVWSSLTTLRVVVEVVVGGMVVVKTLSAMNAVNLVILLENAACVLVHEAWGVGSVEVHPLDAVGVQATMDMGAGLPISFFPSPYVVLKPCKYCVLFRSFHS